MDVYVNLSMDENQINDVVEQKIEIIDRLLEGLENYNMLRAVQSMIRFARVVLAELLYSPSWPKTRMCSKLFLYGF
jgi:hypothetical protein